MMGLTIQNLENCFITAKDLGFEYVAVMIKMEGFPTNEVIINNRENFDAKLAYYKSAYDEKLNHRFSKGISIIGFTFGDTYESIEEDLIKG